MIVKCQLICKRVPRSLYINYALVSDHPRLQYFSRFDATQSFRTGLSITLLTYAAYVCFMLE
jgi:hypothetical protein